MTNPKTLPLLAALDHLYDHNLTIAKLWTTTSDNGSPQTHITTRPKGGTPAEASVVTATTNVYEYQRALPNCVICHNPKDKLGHSTCLSKRCLSAYLLGEDGKK